MQQELAELNCKDSQSVEMALYLHLILAQVENLEDME